MNYNIQGEAICKHEFEGGLCRKCLCPQTPEDQQRAENGYYNALALEGRFSEVLGYAPNHEEAIFEAWRSHKHN